MIEKSRLQELIKQGKPIYYGSLIQKVLMPSKWKNGYRIFDTVLAKLDKNGLMYWQYFYDSMFETKEEAEWYLKFGNITRTETLSLPSWTEIKKDLNTLKNGTYAIAESKFCFSMNLKINFPISQIWIITKYDNFYWNANEDNYIEACKLAKKLFLGEVEE